MRLVVIGGSDAGISAALRARELDPEIEVTVVVSDAYPNFSICGLPFYISGETPSWQLLAHRPIAELEAHGVRLMLNTRALTIDAEQHWVEIASAASHADRLDYHRLIVATGAAPKIPPIMGLDHRAVHLLHTVDDARALADRLGPEVRRAVVVGAGYIGLEMADAFTHRDVAVTLIGRGPEVLPTVDPEIGVTVRRTLESHGVTVRVGAAVRAIEDSRGRGLTVLTQSGERDDGDVVVVGAGVEPSTRLLLAAGAALGAGRAIAVDRTMATGLPDVWAAGDCVQTHHRLLADPVYLPLGTTAHKQGRTAGENAVGGNAVFAGSLGTQVVKVFDKVIAGTGLRDAEARSAGYDTRTVETTVPDHKPYYPGAAPLVIRITADVVSRRLLGVQMIGEYGSEVSKRLDIAAAAIHAGLTITEISDLDLSYTPPLSSPWDPVQQACQEWDASTSRPGTLGLR